jgi:hypothetical protein
MSGLAAPPLLDARTYVLGIETDRTVFLDQQADRTEFLAVLTEQFHGFDFCHRPVLEWHPSMTILMPAAAGDCGDWR